MELGKISSVPITDQFASKVRNHEIEDPVRIANEIRFADCYKKDKFPSRSVFGNNFKNQTIKLPIENREFHNMSPKLMGKGKAVNRFKSSVKVYDQNNRMHWMDASIDLSQPEIKRYKFDSTDNLNNTSSNISNYEFHSRHADRKKSIDSDFRRSHISGEGIINPKYAKANVSESVNVTNVLKVNPLGNLPQFADSMTGMQKKAMNKSMRFNNPPITSIRQKYYQKMGYIDSPLNQVKVPEISSSKIDF